MNARSFTPYATRTQTIHLVSSRRIAEETGDYQQTGNSKRALLGATERIEMEALRRTADAQIGRLLRLANLLDELDGADAMKDERARATESVREAATLLEQYLHSLADAVEANTDVEHAV